MTTDGAAGLLYDRGGAVLNLLHPKYRAIGTWDPVAGTGDVSAAFAQAHQDVGPGGEIVAPWGRYNTLTTLETAIDVSVRGTSWATIFQSATASPILRMTAGSDPNPEVHGVYSRFRVDGGGISNGLTGVQVVKWGTGGAPTARTAVIDALRFTRCGIGLRPVNTQGLNVRDSKFGGANQWDGLGNGVGAYIADNSQVGSFRNSDFRGNLIAAKLEASNSIIGGVIDRIYGWHFDTCHFELNSGQAEIFDGAGFNTHTNCKYEQNGGAYITLQNLVSGYRCDGNQWIGGTFNGNAAVPTVLFLDLKQSKGTLFQSVQFNGGQSGGIKNGSGAYMTFFINSAFPATAIQDLAPQGLGITYLQRL